MENVGMIIFGGIGFIVLFIFVNIGIDLFDYIRYRRPTSQTASEPMNEGRIIESPQPDTLTQSVDEYRHDPTQTPKDIWYNTQPPEPEISMEFSITEAGFKCPICAVEVTKEAEVVRCSTCQTPAHKDCFDFNGKCGVYACGGNDKCKPPETPPAPNPPNNHDVVQQVVIHPSWLDAAR